MALATLTLTLTKQMTFAQLLEDADNVLSSIQKFEQTAGVVTGLIPTIGPAVTIATDATTGAKTVLDGIIKGLTFVPPHAAAPSTAPANPS
jgi:hypothetical protein